MANYIIKSIKHKHFSTYLYLVALLIVTLVCGYLILSSGVESKAIQASRGSISFGDGWVDVNGQPIRDLSKMGQLPDASISEFGVISHLLPEDLPENSSLCFHAKHLYYSVWVEGEMIYQQVLPESRFYTKSDAAVWGFIPLKSAYAGKNLEIHYRPCYEKSVVGIDCVSLGSERGYLLTVLSDKLFQIIISLFFILMAFAFMVADIPMNVSKVKNHELLYLGLLSLNVGIFCFAETQTMQLFIGNEHIMHVFSWITQILVPIPLFLYADEAFGLKWKYSRTFLTLCSMTLLVVLSILNYLRIKDFHEMKYAVHFMVLVGIVVILYAMVRYYIMNRNTVLKSVYAVVRILGMVFLSMTAVIDLSRYYKNRIQDSAATIRVGILVYILCFGAASLDKAITSLRNGARAELITTLAYSDGLTGLGNRTAYKEKIAEIREKAIKFGIVMLDVNNLKTVNDSLGHEYGDKLLMKSADFIRTAFMGARFECYRIGGDEFVVLLYGDKTKKIYEQGRKKLTEICRMHNAQPSVKFVVSIASGYAETTEKQIEPDEICRAADAEMYHNKRKMKLAESI